jgi:hypothetical protein
MLGVWSEPKATLLWCQNKAECSGGNNQSLRMYTHDKYVADIILIPPLEHSLILNSEFCPLIRTVVGEIGAVNGVIGAKGGVIGDWSPGHCGRRNRGWCNPSGLRCDSSSPRCNASCWRCSRSQRCWSLRRRDLSCGQSERGMRSEPSVVAALGSLVEAEEGMIGAVRLELRHWIPWRWDRSGPQCDWSCEWYGVVRS